jgi:predicted aspartyl protease
VTTGVLDELNRPQLAPPTGTSIPVPDLDSGPDYAVPTRIDRIGRIVVPVRVNGQGPFRFVLDTGANTTVISPHLAALLGLEVNFDQTVNLKGVTGFAPVPTAAVQRVETGAVVLEDQRLAVADASAVGTDGILGVDGLAGKLVLVDFLHDRIRVLQASTHRPTDSLVRIPAELEFGRLLVVDALVGNHKVKAVIDTGGQRTLGNRALYHLLGMKPEHAARGGTSAEVFGATEATQQGERQLVRDIRMGNLRVTNLTVTFGDFYIFNIWDLEDTPALVIGMDMIGTLDTFAVDYLRREVQIRVRR